MTPETRKMPHRGNGAEMKRREARETAFMLLYEADYHKGDDYGRLYDLALDCLGIDDDEYIRTVYNGVLNKIDEIDLKITENAVGWKRERLSRVSLAIMRLCIYEMLYMSDIPYNVAINEAVELSKRFDDDNAPAFINGVVNAVADKEGLKNPQ